ncbi:MAG: cob(I)yrinic acid a,c-diamide adenosyltransferase [Dehalococcoidales bacterium]|nr:cob(I)yrinic acid a,c-diamide adenosyltransferase [Dehalococcoidales bacterium]
MTKGLLIINTGRGKGKTTAALGLAMRAWGHDMKVTVLQFIKQAECGEHVAAERIGIEMVAGGAGIIRADNEDSNRQKAVELWKLAKDKMSSGDYDMVILDELSYPLRYGWLATEDATAAVKSRPPAVHVVITGRDVPAELIKIADIVTEMAEVKHPLRNGIEAQPGIEF